MMFNPLALRRWAAHAAFLWLFGLGMGVVNACMAHGAGAPHSAAYLEVTADASVHTSACHGEQPDGAAVKSNCQDFCEKLATASPTGKSGLDGAQPQLGFVAAAMGTLPPPPRGVVRVWRAQRLPVKATPVRLAYTRLSL